ncbi:hypothetical protein [Hymenobacter jeollabukensis]|uniref:Uncharacterized protein n=1 Tax=Hymenobacter jeollabukensis TaxID=2025313 RepID=A0A5R8WKW5_9BACT|nr:hypothetical protein [Hymenobacter jeollabukensis]TLM89213.1 hypothetical protein FDY95_21845 [Hymenobacter jeollabukensis]
MSATQTYPLDCGKQQILSLDADEHGQFVALLDGGEVWANHWRLPLKRPFQFPLIRRVDAGHFLIVEARRNQQDNAFLFSAAGDLLLSFDAGDAVEEVVVQANYIVISYFDEAAGEPPPAGDGLAVFDLNGRQLFGFNSSQAEFILDCYALCPEGADSVLFYPNPEFNLCELRLTDFRLQQWPTPVDFQGSMALTNSRGNVVFWGSYKDKTSFYWWNRHDRVTRFGNVPVDRARGIGNGKFLTHDARSFTIIDAMALMRAEAQKRRAG